VKFTYDIFRNLPNHGPILIEAVQGLENARVRLQNLCQAHPGDYFVYDPSTAKVIFASR
jgi:hypothetical protein